MLHAFGWAALIILGVYLGLFFWGGVLAARSAGRSIWLFGAATGRDRWAAFGFRAAFALSFAGPLIWLIVPFLHKVDPLWTEGRLPLLGLLGLVLCAVGAMMAFAAQLSMGSSWRVGVKAGETGALVQGGLFRFSRNPTFLGQLLLLVGVALAIPAFPAVAGVAVFFWSASVQIRSEEAVLSASNGDDYRAFQASVPRWIGIPKGEGTMSRWMLASLAVLAFAVDQATKSAALAQLVRAEPVPVFPGFNLTLGFNEGASFGMLSGVMAGKPWAMMALTGAITLGLAVLALRARNPWEAAGFALVVGGSLGNIFDRLRQGAVTDFLDFYWRDWHWAAFNMADAAIFIGAGVVLVSALPAFRKTAQHA